MRVCGIDYSTFAIDLVFVDQDTDAVEWHRYPLTGLDAWERSRMVRDAMPIRTSALWDDVIGIGIEQPAGHRVVPLVRIQGAILSCVPTGILIHPYLPARWRVLSGLKGHALKDEVRARSLELMRPAVRMVDDRLPQDAHDAHLVARALLADLARQEAA